MAESVLNKHAVGGTSAPGARYIGRGSVYGNKFVIGRDGTRDDVCEAHDRDLADEIQRKGPKARDIDALRGLDVICFCAPQRCHGDTLVALAAKNDDERMAWANAKLKDVRPSKNSLL